MATRPVDEDDPVPTHNEVLLVGRVAAVPEERALPSGDLLVTLRLVVDRPPPERPRAGARTVLVDTVDCSAWAAGVRRTARSLRAGDVVEVHGSLRRRFWRSGGGAASRTEVEVAALRRLSRAPRAVARRARRTTGAQETAEPPTVEPPAARPARPHPVQDQQDRPGRPVDQAG